MLNTPTPYTLFVNHVHTLRDYLPRLADGDPVAVHDARISTRRIRELLQVGARRMPRGAADLAGQFKKMGRALGRVRDADVRIELVAGLESRMPPAAPWLVTARHAQERKRLRLMRRLIKRLERLQIATLMDGVVAEHAGMRRFLAPGAGAWRQNLCRAVTTRGRLTAEAIERATGVYFPNRSHAARIALKKLRYAMEIAVATGHAELAGAVRELKKGQDVLGDLHDRETLLADLRPSEAHPDGEPFSGMVREVLEAEANSLHGRYLERRARLLEVARDAQTLRLGRRWILPSLATTAGAVAVASGVLTMQRRLPPARP